MDSINLRDRCGKKSGVWVEYVDERLQKVNRKKHSKYYYFNYYHEGKPFYQKFPAWKSVEVENLNDSIVFQTEISIDSESPKLLDGRWKVTLTRRPPFGKGPFQHEILIFNDGLLSEIVSLSNQDTMAYIMNWFDSSSDNFSTEHYTYEYGKKDYVIRSQHVGEGKFERETEYLER